MIVVQKIEIPNELALSSAPAVRHYYVDEAGDSALFNARGKVIVGTPGCSSHFFIGLLSAFAPISLESDLRALNQFVLADSSLNWRGKYKKPVRGFHANDDLPEVRDLVFSLLIKHQFKFFAVIKDKLEAVKYVRQKNQTHPQWRYDGDGLYDNLVSRLFQTRLHKNYEHNVYFASRGHSDRTAALKKALEHVQAKAKEMYNPESTGIMAIFNSSTPSKNVNLQAVDYCLWAIQRFYTLKEDKYLKMIWPLVSMVQEMDSKTGKKNGDIYTKKKHPFEVLNLPKI
jgi:hypothetical protein